MNTFTLGDLAEMKYGKLPPKEVLESGFPIFTGYRVAGFAKTYMYENPMLLVVARGVGGTGDVKLSPPRSWITNLSIVLDLDESRADKQFMCYYLGQQSLKEKLNTGSAQAQITINALSSYQVTIPDLDIQRRIASILSAYDDLIENNTRRIAILEEMARRIYEEWFVRFRFPGHEGVRMVESELGLVPEGWGIVRLDQILVLQRGFDLPTKERSDGPYKVIAATGEHGSHVESKVKGPGVVTGRSGSLGTVTYVHDDFWPLNTTLWVKRFLVGSPIFAFFTLRNIDLKGFNSGAAVPTLNRNDIHSLPVVRPTDDVLSRFDALVEPMLRLQQTLILKNKNLRAARDLLLPKLISGELDVSVLSLPEAAAA